MTRDSRILGLLGFLVLSGWVAFSVQYVRHMIQELPPGPLYWIPTGVVIVMGLGSSALLGWISLALLTNGRQRSDVKGDS